MGTIFRGKDFCGRLVDDVSNDRTLFVTGYRPPIIIKNWRVTLAIAKLWRADFFHYQVPPRPPQNSNSTKEQHIPPCLHKGTSLFDTNLDRFAHHTSVYSHWDTNKSAFP